MHALILTVITTTGTSIMNFTATDCDSGNNSLIQYTITDGNENGHFAINNAGHFIANVVLDREEVSEYSLVITAEDLGNPRLSSSIEVTICTTLAVCVLICYVW